ncbi:hypothetical protein [Sphingomonas hengshuiensis]|uniref:Uncharacterized protein n=1 Tax=Sphingomonas hengshuiensis TaxID=1609977 RepID=A0A7U5BGF3_9SPHN|nr:hypothetical protein [Sphingomonas hengshuiensis]AJP74800.1 hypothetical protein TS85_23775 [Sphingomonas hengshuiensis]
MLIASLLGGAALVAAAPMPLVKPTAYVYCTASSTSPRGQGLIVTSIFRSRSEPAFIRTAFANYLRTSYAPYGNGWVFSPLDVSCQAFEEKRMAETRRNLDISRVPQPQQTVFTVSFQLG